MQINSIKESLTFRDLGLLWVVRSIAFYLTNERQRGYTINVILLVNNKCTFRGNNNNPLMPLLMFSKWFKISFVIFTWLILICQIYG